MYVKAWPRVAKHTQLISFNFAIPSRPFWELFIFFKETLKNNPTRGGGGGVVTPNPLLLLTLLNALNGCFCIIMKKEKLLEITFWEFFFNNLLVDPNLIGRFRKPEPERMHKNILRKSWKSSLTRILSGKPSQLISRYYLEVPNNKYSRYYSKIMEYSKEEEKIQRKQIKHSKCLPLSIKVQHKHISTRLEDIWAKQGFKIFSCLA